MADVIFSGTHQRKALGIADVSLTFDNTSKWLDIPYNEVTVQRRMYRSGESEYRINQETCRLKDIQELFMDTGIGKDGYSFIGQGRIDAVLSNKPEDRRMVFEEAAGITKFKKRKNESIKKLQETLDNLERIQDLLTVLKKQEASLSDDLKKYYDYKEVYEKRKSLDEDFFVLEYQNFQGRKAKVQELIQELSGEMDQLKDDLANKTLSYQEISQELEEKEKDLDQDQEKLQEAIEEWVRFEEKRDRYEDQKRSIQASLDFDKNNITDLQASLLENQENLQTNQEDQEKSRQEEKDLEEKLLGQKNLVNEKKALLNNLVQKENQVKGSLESENQSKLSRDLRIQSMEGMIREGQARLEKLNSLSNQMDREIDYLKGQIQEADQEIQEITLRSKDQGQALEKQDRPYLKMKKSLRKYLKA
ncbi:conserved domain protein [Peptoniphilus sp. oral taxon 375 str. F0436]|nr:conserved domain protein [Peptoniphilus sp. oral taxon 375 str. F0436]